MSARDFSVMPVQFHDEDTPQERRVRSLEKSLRAGSVVEVEIGAKWLHQWMPARRVAGRYMRCVVTRIDGPLLHVVRAP